MPRFAAARATATSPSAPAGENDPSPPVGQRKIGLLYVVPKSCTFVSTSVASWRRRGRNWTWLKISRFARSVASSSTPLAMYAQCPCATLRRAGSSKSNTLNACAGLVMTSRTAPEPCADAEGIRRNALTPPTAATYGLRARNLMNSRRAASCVMARDCATSSRRQLFRRGNWPGPPHARRQRSGGTYWPFMVFRYSGYIVRAPPSTASRGML